MITVSTTSAPEGWKGYTSTSGTTMYGAGSAMRWTAPTDSRLKYRVTFKVYARPATGSTISLQVQSKVYTLTPAKWQTITHDVEPGRPLVATVTGATTLTASTTLQVVNRVLPARPAPADILAIDAYLPATTTAMRWNLDRWNRSSWNDVKPVDGTMRWNTDKWNRAAWYEPSQTHAWQSIIDPVTRVVARRGITATGPVLKAEAGTLTITATQDLDPRRLGMVIGTPVRCYLWASSTPVWSGQVADITVEPLKDGGATVTIVAVDAVSRLASITRYGARPDHGRTETWRQRLARLMTSAPGIDYQVAATSDTPVVPTVWETSLASHIDALVATTGGAWYADRDEGISVYATLPTPSPSMILTDTHDDDGNPVPVWHYTDGPASWSASQLIAAIDATTHDAALNTENQQWNAADTKITVSNATTATAWGGATVSVDMLALSTGDSLETSARRLLRRATTAPLMTSARLIPTGSNLTSPLSKMRACASLDPLTVVSARQRDESGDVYVAGITHDITPTSWQTDITLTPLAKEAEE